MPISQREESKAQLVISGKKIYLVTAQIDVSPSALSAKIEDTEDMCKWNTTLTKHEILRVGVTNDKEKYFFLSRRFANRTLNLLYICSSASTTQSPSHTR